MAECVCGVYRQKEHCLVVLLVGEVRSGIGKESVHVLLARLGDGLCRGVGLGGLGVVRLGRRVGRQLSGKLRRARHSRRLWCGRVANSRTWPTCESAAWEEECGVSNLCAMSLSSRLSDLSSLRIASDPPHDRERIGGLPLKLAEGVSPVSSFPPPPPPPPPPPAGRSFSCLVEHPQPLTLAERRALHQFR